MAVEWTAEQYFADRSALTRSALALLGEPGNPRRPGNPRLFHRRWILGERDGDSDSPAKTRGTHSHLWLLEHAEWCRRVGIPEIPRPPGADGSAKKGTRERDLYQRWRDAVDERERIMAAIPDRIDVSLDEFARLQAIVQSVWSHREAAALLSAPGRSELTVLWREPTTELLVKVRLDRFTQLDFDHVYGTELEVGPAIADVKTTRDHTPYAFARSVADYGYLTQAAMYSDAVAALIGEQPRWYFIATKNESNWGTAVYRPDGAQLQRGRDDYLAKLREVMTRKFTDDWFADCERGIKSLHVPGSQR